ncbi:hypothetical protein PENTCL1PPCAC_18992, partial [Pristionchus entomophagus]
STVASPARDRSTENIQELLERYRGPRSNTAPRSVGKESTAEREERPVSVISVAAAVLVKRRRDSDPAANNVYHNPLTIDPAKHAKVDDQSLTAARLSGSNIHVPFQVTMQAVTGSSRPDTSAVTARRARYIANSYERSRPHLPPSPHHYVPSSGASGGGGTMPIGGGGSRSGSRSGRLARISQSNIRPHGSTVGSSHGLGAAPLPDVSSPTKKDPMKHRFEIVRKLGSGTYGKVSLAYDHKFDREVAVKLIKKSAIENKADLVRIRREIRIMSALNHPNIIQIFEVFENKDKIILVMEYANGGELYDYVSKYGSLQEQEARRIFRQITSAVLYCHKHKVAHRDLKLENILLDSNNHAKIADFGLSNYFSDKTLLNTFCGSPLYASPEIINGTPYRGPEVDCWSLGILLYTLVYGSMPFDGRDFNRMVRQIKKGAYYEPDTPSTASMLIRNMLRVNPERRANIDDIASHWWLNLEENMPVIQELPENRILDHTPLTERPETMMVQELVDEADVFMEFSHLSGETRRKIEEFRRRRKEAEEYNENCPVQPKKNKQEEEQMKTEEKSLRGLEEKKEKAADDPLERLRQIESRLGGMSERRRASREVKQKEVEEVKRKISAARGEPMPPPAAAAAAPAAAPASTSSGASSTASSAAGSYSRRTGGEAAWRVETDSLNMLMNQVLEQMEKGPVSLNLVARIKAHPMYDSRPMVKELLESILAGQPETIQKQTSRILEQATSQETMRSTESLAKKEEGGKGGKGKRNKMEDRKWHSVEVGFENEGEFGSDEEEDLTPEGSTTNAKPMGGSVMSVSAVSHTTEVTVRDTSFEDMDDDERAVTPTPALPKEPKVPRVEEEEEEDEEEDEYSDSELEELAEGVEKVEGKETAPAPVLPSPPVPASSLLSPTSAAAAAAAAASASGVPPKFLDAFDRGLIKRQSKGKYQHIIIDLYGRGLSLEGESPLLPRRRIGGPQPSIEHSPLLFDKARQCIANFPERLNLEDMDRPRRRKKKEDMCIVEVDVHDRASDASLGPPQSRHNGSVPPRTPPPLEESEEEDEDEMEDEESEEESEEEEGEIFIRRPCPPIIGGRIIGTPRTIAECSSQPVLTPPAPTLIYEAPPPPITVLTEAVIDPTARRANYLESCPPSIDLSPEPTAFTVAEINKTPYATQYGVKRPVAVVGPSQESSSIDYDDDEVPPSKEEKMRRILEEAEEALLEESTTAGDSETWQDAAASLKRRNMERRRQRNKTIADPVEISKAIERESERRAAAAHDPLDSFYTQHLGGGGLRVRLHEDSFRKQQPLSSTVSSDYGGSTRINSAAVVRDDRGRSRTLDASPDRPDYRLSGSYGSGSGGAMYGGASPGYSRKFEEPSLDSWATSPRKFEVYKTRAERDAERNTQIHPQAVTAPSSAYRTSYYTDTMGSGGMGGSAGRSSAYYRPKSVYDEMPS